MGAGTIMDIEEHAAGCIGAVMLDASLTLVAVSEGVVSVGGHQSDALIGIPAWDLLHPDDVERAADVLLELARTRVPTSNGSFRLRFSDNTYHSFAIHASTLDPDSTDTESTEQDGNVDGVLSLLRFSAVSEVLRAEELARDAVETLRMLGESHSLGEGFERVHRLTERHLPDTRLAISTIHGGTIDTHRRLPDRSFCSTRSEGRVPQSVEVAYAHHLDGPWRAFNRMARFEATDHGGLITAVLTDEADQLVGYYQAIRTSSAEPEQREWMVHGLVRQVLTALLRRFRLDEQLKAAADHDPLTGLANRRRLFADMATWEDLAGTTLLLIDLDDFSWVNNNLGHHVGDHSLVEFAHRLRELFPPDATIARFGGDEFVVWTSEPLDDLAELEQRLRSSNINPTDHSDHRASLRCSIGATTIREGEAATDAIKRADQAMYLAKSQGGNRIQQGPSS